MSFFTEIIYKFKQKYHGIGTDKIAIPVTTCDTHAIDGGKLAVGNLVGDVSFKDLLAESVGGKYVFHGSNIALKPGIDSLRPSSSWFGPKIVYTGSLDVALRFALVRKWGNDQQQGSDFYVFITPEYKLIVHTKSMGLNWYHGTDPAYIYAIPADALLSGNSGYSGEKLPIAARAEITPVGLFNAGFDIGVKEEALIDLFFVPNESTAITKLVLPKLLFMHQHKTR